MKKEHYIGIMSGTSMDGIDVVLCQINKHECHLIHATEYPFPAILKDELLQTINGNTTLAQIGKLHIQLSELFADAVNSLLSTYQIDPKTVIAIGSHGQTLWHEPNAEYPFSIQLGDPSTLTTRTRIPVVADFRAKDIALGGQGAPLAPSFHQFLFQELSESIAVVNIGGMANITIPDKQLIGYDTGPGNVLMDLWCHKHTGKTYDKDGLWAREGEVNFSLLEKMLEDSYFHQPHPKSTGREKFNEAWINHFIEKKTLKSEDVQRTLLELTAFTICNELLKFQRDIAVLSGGGAKNSFLLERIKAVMPNITVIIAENADMLEAMMMAWLAYKRIHNEHINLKDVTGAKENGILGGVYR
ncbi:anhydro-N-acetylmuramic acid kinase [Sulfurovum sp. zt1-1]|uniref:Anhydro-N-acetylmuramic acid kinase n=1 Tax=Sulfurovum zhangzhouensis TaxID=3019067 RepID=A0ABT7QUV0_9BACT|nr:anhydro-N-acetylmuramic acid kinase [Sulfurovum zhangzhouensis]MDM5270562.1 anhydro-N-acetylmuramic acid kinase [Sulfurovum zhangzhouensis]